MNRVLAKVIWVLAGCLIAALAGERLRTFTGSKFRRALAMGTTTRDSIGLGSIFDNGVFVHGEIPLGNRFRLRFELIGKKEMLEMFSCGKIGGEDVIIRKMIGLECDCTNAEKHLKLCCERW